MFTKEELTVIDQVLKTIEEGLVEINDHPEYSALQAAAAGGSKITDLPNKFRIDQPVLAALRVRIEEVAADEDDDAPLFNVERIFEGIKHGDENHQAWLREALTALSVGQTAPAAPAPAAPIALSEEEVVEIIEGYFTAFPKAKEYFVPAAAKSGKEGGK